jgi:lipopolysaccharide transport system ATP-binding protein
VLDRMDDIVQFAEIDQFLDQPLRHYSSGMYLRLAFSVAINMQPDILLADEILAVGDMAFQERCLQRVAEEGRRGLTVFFVSHDLSALSRLCDRILWLDQGQLLGEGDPDTVLAKYQEAALKGRTPGRFMGDVQVGRHANVVAEIASVRLLNAAGETIGAAPMTEDVSVRIRIKVRKPGAELRGVVDVLSKGVFLFRAVQAEPMMTERRGVVDLIVRIPANLLAETTYTVNVTVLTFLVKESKVVLPNALTFIAYGDEQTGQQKTGRSGVIAPRLSWDVKAHENARKKQRKVKTLVNG